MRSALPRSSARGPGCICHHDQYTDKGHTMLGRQTTLSSWMLKRSMENQGLGCRAFHAISHKNV
jgi:hypothetical protein